VEIYFLFAFVVLKNYQYNKDAKSIMANIVFTIGHSTHTIINFIKLLNRYSVSLICDVRSQPY